MVVCNACKKKVTPQQGIRVTTCQHLYCNPCAAQHFAKTNKCRCGTSLEREQLYSVDGNLTETKMRLLLCGQPPEVILKTAEAALSFWTKQQGIESQLVDHNRTRADGMQKEAIDRVKRAETNVKLRDGRIQALEQKLAGMQRQAQAYVQKQVATMTGQAKQRIAAVEQQRNGAVAEKRKFEELYHDTKRRCNELERRLADTPADAMGVGGAAMPPPDHHGLRSRGRHGSHSQAQDPGNFGFGGGAGGGPGGFGGGGGFGDGMSAFGGGGLAGGDGQGLFDGGGGALPQRSPFGQRGSGSLHRGLRMQ